MTAAPTGTELVHAALSLIERGDLTYRLGGVGPLDFDCSGFIQHVAAGLGVEVPRHSAHQYETSNATPLTEAPAAGTLLYRPASATKTAHVGLADGTGGVVHASSPTYGVVHHSNAGPVGFTHAALIPGIDYSEARMARMSSPTQGRVSSPYGQRAGGFHAGIDISTNGKPGTVHATFAGTVEKIVRGRARGDRSRVNELAPYRTGNGLIVRNPDGERQLYGHVDVPSSIRVGTKVDVGDVLGETDLSGNTSGYHVHYEEWLRSGATRNPQDSFRKFGITAGGAPLRASNIPDPKPSSGYPSEPTSHAAADLKSAWYQFLDAKGYEGDTATRLQKWLNDGGERLLVDGDWGAATTAALQRRLRNAYRTTSTKGRLLDPGPADEVRGLKTKKAEAAYLNHLRYSA